LFDGAQYRVAEVIELSQVPLDSVGNNFAHFGPWSLVVWSLVVGP
jgi:hypothetical protein